MSTDAQLPIEAIKDEFLETIELGPVVVTAPTGSGKSTQVPRWCATIGRVLVVEPRRVACRGLAQRVSVLEGSELGVEVGYSVRDDSCSNPDTQLLFATPGVVLRQMAKGDLSQYDTVVLDEFHERSLDVDLLLALLMVRFHGHLVVMSATLAAERVASHLGGAHLHAEGRAFEVTCRHVPGKDMLPTLSGLEERIGEALHLARKDSGDILIFLPGKAEIARAAERLQHLDDFEVMRIHGGLTLKEQARIFEPGTGRRIILSTNVAETSITIPRIGVVIDSGLVRRTRYVSGRGFLTMVPVAMDSADQRMGRAGRTEPGVCYRLWNTEARLEHTTPPEIYRESLSPLILGAAACNAQISDISFLDPPKEYALVSALEDLTLLGAVDSNGQITERGRILFGLPLDASLGNFLVEAEKQTCLEDAIDLVSALFVGRPMFIGDRRPTQDDDLRLAGCDASALISAVRRGDPKRHRLSRYVLDEARSMRRRLRTAWSLRPVKGSEKPVRRDKLARAALRADPRSAYVARRRRGRLFFGNGSQELELARESAVNEDKVEAIAVLGSMAVGLNYRNQRIYATCAMPLRFKELVREGFGEDRIKHVGKEGSTVIAKIERVYAGQVIDSREEVPVGALARQAIEDLFLGGRLFPKSLEATRDRLAAVELLFRLKDSGYTEADLDAGPWHDTKGVVPVETWVQDRLFTLGVTSGEDLTLLSDTDLLAPDLPQHTRGWLDREFPRSLKLGDAEYRISYDFRKKEATLVMVAGRRKDPPSLFTLPTLGGLRIRVQHHSKVLVIRERR
ncbi:MAG: ATP-dependent RNA helicase [Proteobacteria bacterium]|nr:ATP-dependent RNA helicase [Pseudomonadota bacterium]